jgi:hypothetical protein
MRVIAVLLASFWLFGCGPSAEGPTSVTDSGAPDTALNDAKGADVGAEVTCNNLVLDAPSAKMTFTSAPSPAALGGTIADGTYFLSGIVGYGSSSSSTVPSGRTKIVVSGGSWQWVDTVDDISERRFTYSATVSGTSLSLARTCPSGSTRTNDGRFTATATEFTIFVVDGGVTFGSLFVKK